MQNFIIVTKEGWTLPPNSENGGAGIDNLQVLGFVLGNSKKEAIRKFVLENKWVKVAGFSEVMVFALGEGLENEDFRSVPLTI